MTRVVRPVVRSFGAQFAREAAAWALGGGHSVYWESKTRARLFVPKPDGSQTDLGLWAILDLGRSRYQVLSGGAFDGLASVVVPRSSHWIVKRRAERDSVIAGPTRKLSLDCGTCGSCCRSNEVVLERADLERLRERPELIRRPFAKRRADGKIVLVLLRSNDCKHLGNDNRCGIYELRPNACRSFPIGSECCLYAREDEMGLYDGLPPEGSVL